MQSGLLTELAIFIEFKTVSSVFLIFISIIVTLFTFGARKSNSCSVVLGSHSKHLQKNYTPEKSALII